MLLSNEAKRYADAMKRLQAETAADLDALLPAILPFSRGFDPAGDRAWTHSLPARSGCALLLHRILFAHSQCAQIKREL
jgi:hypothetical protein